MAYQVSLGYVPISSSALRPLGAAYIPILLSEVEQEQIPSGNGDREAIVVGAGLCDGEGEHAYTGVNGNGSKEMGRIGLLFHGSNLHRFGIGSNGLGSTLKNAKFYGDNILISTQFHSIQFDLSQFDLSYSNIQ